MYSIGKSNATGRDGKREGGQQTRLSSNTEAAHTGYSYPSYVPHNNAPLFGPATVGSTRGQGEWMKNFRGPMQLENLIKSLEQELQEAEELCNDLSYKIEVATEQLAELEVAACESN